MINRKLFVFFMVCFVFLGIGIDLLRPTLLARPGKIQNPFPFVLIYDAFIEILFVFVIFVLSWQAHKINIPKITSFILIVFGLYVVCIPLLYGTFLVPAQISPFVFASREVHRTLAGAFMFVVGTAQVFYPNKGSKEEDS